MSEELIYPVEASKSGKNAYYHRCDVRDQAVNYAVCLFTLEAIEEGRIKEDQFSDCQGGCKNGTCDAIRMRRQEKKAGHALFYKERILVNPANTRSEAEARANALVASSGKYDLTNESFARGWAQVGSKLNKPDSAPRPVRVAQPKPVAAPASVEKSDYIEQDFSKVVNAIAESENTTKPATPEPKPVVSESKPVVFDDKPMPGETPLQFARRRAAAMKG